MPCGTEICGWWLSIGFKLVASSIWENIEISGCLVSRFLGFLVVGCSVSRFLGFSVSKFQSFKTSQNEKSISCCLKILIPYHAGFNVYFQEHIDLVFKNFKNLLYGSSCCVVARLFQHVQSVRFPDFLRFTKFIFFENELGFPWIF